MDVPTLIGRTIRVIREQRGMSQQQLGDRLADYLETPWPRQAVSAAENGRRTFPAVELIALATALDTTLHELASPAPDVHMVEIPGPFSKRVAPTYLYWRM